MRKSIALAAPLLMVLAGLYIILFTPDVVTAYTEHSSSHLTGILIILIGGLFGFVAFMLVED